MNPLWLARNIRNATAYAPSVGDALRRVRWTYDKQGREWDIRFRYAAPVGPLHLRVRGNQGSDCFIHGEVFEHRYYDIALPRRPQTILDLGANIGLTSIYYARAYPGAQLACVEPMPNNVRLLRENLALNGIAAHVFPAAVSTEDGVIRMAVHAKDYGHPIAGAGDSSEILECEGVSVPTLMQRLGWDRIGLLKMDIEGYEKHLLADSPWMEQVDAMAIEIHDGFTPDDLAKVAERHGFTAPALHPGAWLITRPAV